MAEQAYAYVTLIPVAKGFQNAVAKELSGVGGTTGKTAGNDFKSGFGKSLKGLAAVAGTAIAAAGVGQFFSSAVGQASDLNESINAVNVAFGDSAKGILEFGKTSAKELGIAAVDYNNAAVRFSAFADRIVGAGQDSSQFIADVTTRAADFASVFNIDVSEALQVFQSGLAGEAEPLKRFGINLLDSEVKAYAMANGIGEVGRELTETEKVQARYGLLLQSTAKTQGDFANTSGELANATRILESQFKDLQAEVGSKLLPALNELVPTIIPIVEDAAPLLVKILEAAIPVVDSLAESMGPLFEAVEPLIETFALLAEAAGEIIATALPPFIELLGILTPIVLKVVEALLPIVTNLLPIFVKLIESLLPHLERFVDFLDTFIVPLMTALGELLGGVLAWGMDLFARAFENLNTILGPVYQVLKPILEGLLALAGIEPASLKKEVVITTNYKTVGKPAVNTSTLEGILAASGPGFTLGKADTISIDTSSIASTGVNTKAQLKELLIDTKKALIENRKEYNEAIEEANKDYAQAQLAIAETYEKAITDATTRRDEGWHNAVMEYHRKVEEINAQSAEALNEIVQQSMDRLRDAYRSAIEVNVADMFSSETVGKNIDGLIQGLQERLSSSRELVASASELASEGFSQTFIEQVVAAGTEVGNELAQGILNATPEQKKELQELFGLIEDEAAHGMDALAETLYEKNGLATEELTNMYDQVLIDQRESLAEQKALYDQAMEDVLVKFNEEVALAKEARDEALQDAEDELTAALLKANEAFLKGLNKIDEDFKKKIKGMKGEISSLKSQIDSLNSAVSKARTSAESNIAGLEGLIPMAEGGLVTGPTRALIGEAGPELVIPLDRVESMVSANQASGKSLNYYAAPNQSVDSEQALFQAMRRAKVVANW